MEVINLKNRRLTITLDENSYRKLENEKKKRNSNRSALIQEIIQYYFNRQTQEEKVKQYIKGYQAFPENTEKVAELEKEQYQVLDKEF